MVIIFLLALIIIIEGIGTIIPRELIFYLYLILPVIFFIQLIIKKKSVIFPKYPSITFGFFLILSFISAIFFSVDKQISFELALFYLSSFLIFIFFYNNKKLAKKYIKLIIFIGSTIFTLIYLFRLNTSPIDGYQLVVSYYGHIHNHLGDFLGLGLIVFIYSLIIKKENNWSYLLILFFPFFMLSFSRTAYVALLITTFFILIRNKSISFFSIKTTLVIILVILSMVFFFATVKEADNKTIVGKLNQLLSVKFNLQSKDFTARRLTYLEQGLKSFVDHPLFGVGPGNFGYSSKKYQSEKSQWYEFTTTDNAHNLSLDILFESGGLAFIFFELFIILLLISIFKKNNLQNYLLLYLLINFQTDYTYKIYSVFILFMILAATVYEEKTSKANQSFIFNLFSICLLFIVTSILTSGIFLRLNKPGLSLTFYPLNKDAYREKIIQDTAKKGCLDTEKLAKKYYFVSP
ncbi:MAG: O-antigen ligase family protein, partial [Patescibacteria group bacterium]